MHGGASTGPTTAAGREKCRRANWKHGDRSAETIANRRAFRFRILLRDFELKHLAKEVNAWCRFQRRFEDGTPAPLVLLEALKAGWSARPNNLQKRLEEICDAFEDDLDNMHDLKAQSFKTQLNALELLGRLTGELPDRRRAAPRRPQFDPATILSELLGGSQGL